MDSAAVVFDNPGTLAVRSLELVAPQADAFPGMVYPLVPGYESVGVVAEVHGESETRVGDWVFVPGAHCFSQARCLFGGTAARLIVPSGRTVRIDSALGPRGVSLSLAATAYNAVRDGLPDLIIGHGALGRLVARLVIALGGEAPTVWEKNPARQRGAVGYRVSNAADDDRRDYRCICEVSGDASLLDDLIMRLRPGGEIILAAFYADALSFRFPPAFIRRARLRVAAEWQPADLADVQALVQSGALSLNDLVTHTAPLSGVADAYRTAFHDSECVKMVLDWRTCA